LSGKSLAVVTGVLALLIWSTPGTAQGPDPDAPIPEGSHFTIVDLKFRIEPVAGAVQALEVKETATEIRIEMPADVLFDFDKADIRPEAQQVLSKAAEIIRGHTKRRIVIEGHTDAKGSEQYNQRLSERRADAVRRWLQDRENLKGVAMRTKGWGANRPIAPNTKPDGSDDPEGRQRNRRVEIVIEKRS
jgi:outer membrane protein OmpA-like peptidoglycan-associated protein